MRSCAAVTLVLMLLLFGIPWLAEAPEGGQACLLYTSDAADE